MFKGQQLALHSTRIIILKLLNLLVFLRNNFFEKILWDPL